MDDLQGGFQTAPVKLPLTPYQKAVSAREAIVQIVRKQMDAISSGKVCLTFALSGSFAISRFQQMRDVPHHDAVLLHKPLPSSPDILRGLTTS